MKNFIFLFLFFLVLIGHLYVRTKNLKKAGDITKLLLAPLAFFNTFMNIPHDSDLLNLLILAYLCYMAGDFFLLRSDQKSFGLGIVAFFMGHLCFILQFFARIKNPMALPIVLVIMLYPLYKLLAITRNAGKAKLPMRIYTLMMCFFIASSAMTMNFFLLFGTTIFTLSDTLLAKNVTSQKKIHSDIQVMGTYGLALIALSIGTILL
jgi:uncharacterized membrane protein YhhN